MNHEPPSYWQQRVPPTRLSADLPSRVDVAVVGGGLLGAATCYWLARAGATVVLLERTGLASGATGRNGGMVSIGTAQSYPRAVARLGHTTARDVWMLTLQNRALLRQVLVEEQIICDYREVGHLSLALREEHLVEFEHTVTALQADGFAATLLDRRQVQALVDTPLGPEVVGGKFVPEQGLVHSARLVHGLVGAAQQHGACACLATVTQLAADGAGVFVSTTRGMVCAGAVVVAINAWTDELLPVLTEQIRPVRGQVLAYAPITSVFRIGMSVALTTTGEYWQQTRDGTIVLGGCRAVAAGQDVDVRVSQPTPEVQTALEQVLPRLFPQLGGLRVQHRWAGLMAFTPDFLPIADRASDIPRVWVVGGFSGHGMTFGMRLGQLLAEAATSGRSPAALAPFRLDRPTLMPAHQPPSPVSWLWNRSTKQRAQGRHASIHLSRRIGAVLS